MLPLDSQVKEAGALRRWLSGFPPESINRLCQINTSTGSARHVVLAVAFGTFDKRIRELNRLITGLLVARMKAERKGDLKQVSRINLIMEEVHYQVDCVTGVSEQRRTQCNRPARMAASPQL